MPVRYSPVWESPSTEVFKASDEKVAELTRETPQVTTAQFKSMIKPGDVVITYIKKSIASFKKKMSVTLTQLAQGSSFSSSKIVGKDAKEIIGYDARPNGGVVLNTCPIDLFLRTHEIVLVFRCPKVDQAKAAKIVKYHYDKMGEKTPYAYGKVFLSFFEHLFADEEPDSANKDKHEDDKRRELTLFCGSVIHFDYKAAGVNLRYSTNISGDYVWPKDLMFSPDLKCLGGYFSKESGMRK